MTTTLYHAPSTAALVVHWMLIELQVPHVLHPLDFDRREQKSPPISRSTRPAWCRPWCWRGGC